MILIIDNKDSFTYNIVDYVKQSYRGLIEVIDVKYLTVNKIHELAPKAIIISPGPGAPRDYPLLNEVIKTFSEAMPILGVCLGFQQIVTYFGGDIIKSDRPIHGHTTQIRHSGKGLFHQLPETFKVMRYHSLKAHAQNFPNTLEITAINEDNIIMGLEHKVLPIYGVQYHPESILSEHGLTQIQTFINIVEAYHANTL